MIILALLSLLTGMVLGMRFKVLILVPAIACILPIAFGFGIVRDHGLGSAIIIAAAALASVQIGYFGGALVRYSLAAARMSGLRSASLAGSQTARRAAH
jgi:uncharacterized membrane protein